MKVKKLAYAFLFYYCQNSDYKTFNNNQHKLFTLNFINFLLHIIYERRSLYDGNNVD